MNSPSFSIITVSFNSSKTIRRTIDSVLNQTQVPQEYILIDGGSTDGTVDIIRSYEKRFADKSISYRWLSERDNGIYHAMNKGLERVKGGVIGILNSDDWYERETLALVSVHYQLHPATAVGYGILRVYSDGQPISVWAHMHSQLSKHMFPHPATFVRKSAYDAVGEFNERYRIAADYDFMLRVRKAGFDFSFCPHVLTNCNAGGASDQHADSGTEMALVQYSHGLISRRKYYTRVVFSRLWRLLLNLKDTLD
jgi:glycosyltransferase involved in cell wall biosynthesis